MKKKMSSPFKRKMMALTIIFSVVLTISLRMYQGFQVDLLMQDLHKLEKRKATLISQTNKLRAEVDRLKNVDRISRLAKEKFGLVINNDPVAVITIKDYDELRDLRRKFATRKKKVESPKVNLAGVQ